MLVLQVVPGTHGHDPTQARGEVIVMVRVAAAVTVTVTGHRRPGVEPEAAAPGRPGRAVAQYLTPGVTVTQRHTSHAQ